MAELRPRSGHLPRSALSSVATVQTDQAVVAGADHNVFARRALAAYDLPAGARARLISLSENATFLVEGERPIGVLRVYRDGNQSAAAMRSELAWIEALRGGEVVDTPAVIPTVTGDGLHWVTVAGASRACVMFEHVVGTAPAEDDLETYALVGRAAATLHLQTQQWQRPDWFTRAVWDVDTILGPGATWGLWSDGPGLDGAATATLARAEAKVRDRLSGYPAQPPAAGLVHCDMRAANLIKGPEGRVWVIDFDDAGFSWYLWDLCSSTTFVEHQPHVGALIESWLRGYRQVRPLSDADLAAIPDLVFLRRLHILAWLGSHAESDLAHELDASFTAATVDIARRYLDGTFLAGVGF